MVSEQVTKKARLQKLYNNAVRRLRRKNIETPQKPKRITEGSIRRLERLEAKYAPKKPTIREQYEREYKRVAKQIVNLLERGYEIPQADIPRKLKAPKRTDIEKLRKIKPSNLIKKSRYKTPEGEYITGKERRKQEIKEEKALKKTRKSRNKVVYSDEFIDDFVYTSEGDIVLNKVLNMIFNLQDTKFKNSASHLKTVLDNEIANYGQENVIKQIAQAPQEFLDNCEIALFYKENSNRHSTAILHIEQLLKGTILSPQEIKETSDIVEQDEEYYVEEEDL